MTEGNSSEKHTTKVDDDKATRSEQEKKYMITLRIPSNFSCLLRRLLRQSNQRLIDEYINSKTKAESCHPQSFSIRIETRIVVTPLMHREKQSHTCVRGEDREHEKFLMFFAVVAVQKMLCMQTNESRTHKSPAFVEKCL